MRPGTAFAIGFWIVVPILLIFAIVHQPPAPKPKPCPHYETIQSVKSTYGGAWTGTIVTITMEDGTSIQSQKHQVTNYVGQKICSTDLDTL